MPFLSLGKHPTYNKANAQISSVLLLSGHFLLQGWSRIWFLEIPPHHSAGSKNGLKTGKIFNLFFPSLQSEWGELSKGRRN